MDRDTRSGIPYPVGTTHSIRLSEDRSQALVLTTVPKSGARYKPPNARVVMDNIPVTKVFVIL